PYGRRQAGSPPAAPSTNEPCHACPGCSATMWSEIRGTCTRSCLCAWFRYRFAAMAPGGGEDELDDRVEGDRGGVDHHVVQRCVGRVDTVQAPNVGGAGPVGRLHVSAGLLLADALDRGALDDPAVRRAVQPDVEAAVPAEYHRSGPAEDHAPAVGDQVMDPGLGAAPQVLVLVTGGEG